MNAIAKFSATTIPSSLITLLLLALMATLVYVANPEIVEEPPVNIGPIYHQDTPPTTFPKTLKPETPDDVTKMPPRIQRLEPGKTHPVTGGDPWAQSRSGIKPVVISPVVPNSDYIPVYVPAPRFPTKAINKGVSGYAIVKVTITTSGAVRTPTLVEEYPTGYGFGRSALKASAKLKYNPRMVDGTPVEVPGVMYKFSFALE